MAISFRNGAGDGSRMTPVRYYRVWIYSVNSLVIVFQTMMVWWIHGMFTHQWWQYIPFEEDHPTIIALEIQIGVQYFACIVGIMGVLFSNKSLLTIYWLLMIPLLFFDVVMAALLMFRMKNVHSTFHDHFEERIVQHLTEDGTFTCSLWTMMQEKLSCCTPKALAEICSQGQLWTIPTLCQQTHHPCNANILRWMHTKTDFVGIIIFFVLFPLKIIVVMVLREDIGELFSEIVYSNHAKLYKHDEDDEDYCEPGTPERKILIA